MPASSWAGALALLALAPALPGLALKTRAWLTGRTGSPVLQPYRDIAKLLRRGRIESRGGGWPLAYAPAASAAAGAAALCFVPVAGRPAMVSFPGDLIVFAGLLALGRFFLGLGSLDAGSSFQGMGASRELAVSIFGEPALLLSFLVLVLATRQLSLSGIFAARLQESWAAAPAALVMAAVALFIVMLAEAGRGPVDDPTTHLELTMIHEVMVLEYGGPDLALVLASVALRFALFAALLAGLVTPRLGLAARFVPIAFAGFLVLIPVAVGTLETLVARLRLSRVPLLLISASIVSLLGCLLVLR